MRSTCPNREGTRVCFEVFRFREHCVSTLSLVLYPCFRSAAPAASRSQYLSHSFVKGKQNLTDIIWQPAGSNCVFGFQSLYFILLLEPRIEGCQFVTLS